MTEISEQLDIVDQNDHILYQTSRGEAYKKGLLHRAVSIFVYNSQGEIFIQQRSATKRNMPLYWDLSAAEHLKPGETYRDAAIRGLSEELSIKMAEVELLIPVHPQESRSISNGQTLIDNELVETYKTIYDGNIVLDPGEVANGKFMSVDQISQMIEDAAVKFTPWFLDDWSRLNNV